MGFVSLATIPCLWGLQLSFDGEWEDHLANFVEGEKQEVDSFVKCSLNMSFFCHSTITMFHTVKTKPKGLSTDFQDQDFH